MAKKKDINEMNIDELKIKLTDLQKSLFNFKFQKALQQLEHPQKIGYVKREIARAKTFIKEYELGIKK